MTKVNNKTKVKPAGTLLYTTLCVSNWTKKDTFGFRDDATSSNYTALTL